METSNDIKKLEELLLHIRYIYAETTTSEKLSLEKRISNYNQASKSIDLASQLLSKVQSEINSMDLTHVNRTVNQERVNQMIDLLENPKLTLVQSLGVLTDLKQLRTEIPTSTSIVPNVKQDEVLLEEVNDF